MNIVKPHPARPKYSLGQTVLYVDHHNREQVGEVKQIEAKWGMYGQAKEHAHISMKVSHPTYRNGVHYTDEQSIVGVVE